MEIGKEKAELTRAQPSQYVAQIELIWKLDQLCILRSDVVPALGARFGDSELR